MEFDIQSFFIEEPLYNPRKFDITEIDKVWSLLTDSHQLDVFCQRCNLHSIYQSFPSELGFKIKHDLPMSPKVFGSEKDQKLNFLMDKKFFSLTFSCIRKLPMGFPCLHKINFDITFFSRLIDKDGETVCASFFMKTGQYPSLSDLMQPDLDKYKKFLSPSKMRELKTGLRLGANGIGIGSFTYLRRIFEDLIEMAHKVALESVPEWNENAFQTAKIKEKINMIQDYLPDFVVKNKEIYGLLSGGIHTYEEEICLDMFPVMRRGIIAMLEAQHREREQQKEFQDVGKQIARLQSRVAEFQKNTGE